MFPGNDRFWQQNVLQDRKSFITQSKLISGESRFSGFGKDCYFLKFPRWQHKLNIQTESSRIQKLGKQYNRFTNQQNLLSHKWFKNTTDFDHKL